MTPKIATANPCIERRESNETPYAKWSDGKFRYSLLKSYSGSNRKPMARWFMKVVNLQYQHDRSNYDLGDVYVASLVGDLKTAKDLVVDPSVFPTKADFIAWATQS